MKHKKVTTNYVCCDKCFIKYGGALPKIDCESSVAKHLQRFINKGILLSCLCDFIRGLLFKVPLCCNISFCLLGYKKLRPAITQDMCRYERYNRSYKGFSKKLLNGRELNYINKIRLSKGWKEIS